MANTPLLADLERSLDLLKQVDESRLDFAPDPNVSPDIRELTGLEAYPPRPAPAREDRHQSAPPSA